MPFANPEIVMLVLTRQEGEKIYIGTEIVVLIAHNGNDRVSLGIDAPADKVVLRAELHESHKGGTDEPAAVIPFDSDVPMARCG